MALLTLALQYSLTMALLTAHHSPGAPAAAALVALHAADMADPAKPVAIAIEWAARAMDEFFAQGDLEAQLGL